MEASHILVIMMSFDCELDRILTLDAIEDLTVLLRDDSEALVVPVVYTQVKETCGVSI